MEEQQTILIQVLRDIERRIRSHRCDPECPRAVVDAEKEELRHVVAVLGRQFVSLQMRILRQHAQPEMDPSDEEVYGERPTYCYFDELPDYFCGLQETTEYAIEWLYDRRPLSSFHPTDLNFICKALRCHMCDLQDVEQERARLNLLYETKPLRDVLDEGVKWRIWYESARTSEDELYRQPITIRLVYWPLSVGASWYVPVTNGESL